MGLQAKNKAKLLVLKDNVSKAFSAQTLVGGSAILADTTGSIEIFDDKGTSLGYIALFDTETLL